MFNILLFKSTAETNRVNKSPMLSQPFVMEGVLRDSCSITDPIVRVHSKESVISYNYAYIGEFGRYYFITSITSACNGMWDIEMHVDVLMSFKDKFLELSAFIGRNAKEKFGMIADPLLPFSQKLHVLETSVPFNDTNGLDVMMIVNVANSERITFNGDGNTNNDAFSAYPSGNLNGSGKSYKTYIITGGSGIFSFFRELYTQSAWATYIMSIYLAPFPYSPDWVKGFTRIDNGTLGLINLSDEVSGTTINIPVDCEIDDFTSSKLYFGNNNPIIQHSVNIYPSRIIDNVDFRLLPPYSNYRIYLPWYGWYEIDGNLIGGLASKGQISDALGNDNTMKMTCTYNVDPSDGSCNIGINLSSVGSDRSTTNYFIGTVTFDMLVPLPTTYTTADNVIRNRTSAQLAMQGAQKAADYHFYGRLFSSIMSVASTGASLIGETFNPKVNFVNTGDAIGAGINAVGGMVQATADMKATYASSTANYKASQVNNIQLGGYTNTQSTSLRYYLPSDKIIFQRVYSKCVEGSDSDEFADLVGRVSYKTAKLKDMHGFTMVNEIRLDIDAMLIEKDELRRMLNAGVVLP